MSYNKNDDCHKIFNETIGFRTFKSRVRFARRDSFLPTRIYPRPSQGFENFCIECLTIRNGDFTNQSSPDRGFEKHDIKGLTIKTTTFPREFVHYSLLDKNQDFPNLDLDQIQVLKIVASNVWR